MRIFYVIESYLFDFTAGNHGKHFSFQQKNKRFCRPRDVYVILAHCEKH